MSVTLLALAIALFTIIAWRDLKLAILLTLVFLPSYLIRFSVGPVPFTLLEILLLIVFLVFFIRQLPNYSITKLLNYSIILLILAATIGVVVAPDRLAALGIWKSYFIEPILFFYVVRSTLINEMDRRRAREALGLGALLVSIFAITQYFTGYGIPSPWDFERRVTSFFEYPNAVGLYLAPIISIAVMRVFSKVENLKTRDEINLKLYWSLVTILGLIAIVLAKTEASLVAIPTSLLLIWFIRSLPHSVRSAQTRKWIFGLASAVVAIGVVLSIPVVREKLLLQDSSGLVRRSQWNETFEMLKDNWLFGAGLSGYPTALEPYHNDIQYEIFQYPHNIILNIWSELGLLGLVAFLWIATLVLRGVVTSPTGNYSITQLPNYLIATALLTMIIHGLVDVPYFKNDLAVMTWSLLALISWPSLASSRSFSGRYFPWP